jgi:hypothetical protein
VKTEEIFDLMECCLWADLDLDSVQIWGKNWVWWWAEGALELTASTCGRWTPQCFCGQARWAVSSFSIPWMRSRGHSRGHSPGTHCAAPRCAGQMACHRQRALWKIAPHLPTLHSDECSWPPNIQADSKMEGDVRLLIGADMEIHLQFGVLSEGQITKPESPTICHGLWDANKTSCCLCWAETTCLFQEEISGKLKQPQVETPSKDVSERGKLLSDFLHPL